MLPSQRSALEELAVRVIPGVGARVAGLLFLACICASQVWIALGLGARLRASAPG